MIVIDWKKEAHDGVGPPVELKIDQIKFPSRITFSNQLPNNFICVLGGKGFFDHFQVNLDYNNKTITLS